MYKLKELPFSYQDLEPYIDTHTIGLHYNKHQRNYLKNLNNILIKNNFSFNYPIEELYKHLDSFKQDENDLLFNLGGVVNHDLYWQSINPNNKEEPNELLLNLINNKYTSLDNFKKEFINYALNLKGSGYIFLIINNNEIELMTTTNQDSPLKYGYTPLLCVDMWEHAYYLNYQNNKQEYLDNFWQILNFKYANELIKRIS